ncbi:MAG TPA: PD-(D/E)XK nuclease family protein [Candidatus Methylacidiphilales bacterium]|nr:PD-(D/E)XK nuclease family protein [Candidatus Methylacidiphilales bacterium]
MPVRLFQTTSVEEQWRLLAGPWLREQAISAWKNPKPTVVLTPGRAESFYLRGRLVTEGVSFLGLRFWTPSDARKFLSGALASGVTLATRADLQLLARICVKRLLQDRDPADAATLNSVARDPEPFLRAYDLLLGAGWNPADDGPSYGRPLARAFGHELARRKISTQTGFHRHLFGVGREQKETRLANVLIVGFNATHWPLWDLLRAVVAVSEETIVALSAPRYFGEEADQLWIGSWEEAAQGEAVLPSAGPGPDKEDTQPGALAALADSYEGKITPPGADAADLVFLVTPDLASQVRAVVLQAVDYLRRDSCARLGILFPEPNALALGVVEELRRLGIPFDDGVGAIQPGLFERRFWQAWLAWQEEPSVARLIHWLRACEAQGVSCGLEAPVLSARKIADVLQGAFDETLIDDLDFLAEYLREVPDRWNAGAVADFLSHRAELPAKASFARFLAATRQTAERLGWKEHLAALPADLPPWFQDWNEEISRRAFLQWLRVSADSREQIRGAEGNHFYGRVHLLIYAQMTGQTWSHLILTGMNESVWPPVFEAGAFGSRYELTELNRQAQALNRLGTGEGSQGTGQTVALAGRGYCLLPQEYRDLAARDLCEALDSTRCAVALAAMTTEAGRGLLPSDFFNHLFQVKTGQALDEAIFQSLALTTSDWCSRHDELFHAPPSQEASLAATRLAYDARRDASRPFGPYEFAYAHPPSKPIQLACKTWETAYSHPAQVWLSEIVGAAKWPEGALHWLQAIGIWTHRWIGLAFQACRERNSTGDFLLRLREIVGREPDWHGRARAAGLELHPWWDHVRSHARSIALCLGETLAPHLPGKAFSSEFTLPENLLVALPGMAPNDFSLRGRIDLLLIEPGAETPGFTPAVIRDAEGWVIDFKTGAAQTLTEKRIAQGAGLQAVLYALAVRALGANEVYLSLHTADTPLKRQIDLGRAVKNEAIFRSLDILHRRGVFGERGDTESDYGFAPRYPMATRPVSAGILETKWALVHGGVPADGEEET